MYLRYVLLLLSYHIVTGMSLPATYDQRQTGDLNVQVHLKDVQVLALLDSELLDDYTEYDYFYDYADFTVKPIVKPTTSTTESALPSFNETTERVDVSGTPDSPSINSTLLSSTNGSLNANATTEDTTIPVSMIAEKINVTTGILSTESTEGLIKINDTLKTRVNDKNKNFFDDNDEDSAVQTFTRGPSTKLPEKRCRNGYTRDGKGRCRRLSQRRLSLIPLAIKLAPKLLDDLARSTKNLAQQEVHRMHSN
nr:uncharacterized protein LOC117610013 [Osmia lignaria]